jgi:signal transduction histidine kinase/ligand-binding sensor domain-containing protein
MKHCKTILTLWLLLSRQFLPLESYAQLPLVKFEIISSEDGLPSNTVYCAMREKNGFMWFGTRLCPVRYDGATFKSFREPESTSVTGLAEDKEKKIWYAANDGKICNVDAATHKINTVNGNEYGSDFYIDSEDRGWFSDRQGVNRLDLKTGAQVRYLFKPTKFIWNKGSFVEGHDRTLWVIGRDNGLFRYDARQDSFLCVFGSDCSDTTRNDRILLTNASADQAGFLWIGSYNKGLLKYDPRTNVYESFPSGRADNTITAVAEGIDENGKRILWVGDGQGIGIFRPEEEKFYFFKDIMPAPFRVNHIYRDALQGIVWISTTQGIVKCHPKSDKIKTIFIPPGLVNFPVTVNAVVKDKTDPENEIYYLGLSHTGMLRWNRSTNVFSLISYESNTPQTKWMAQRSDGTLWIGTVRWDYKRPGIFIYDPVREKFIKPSLGRIVNKRFSVPFFHFGFFDADDRLWIGNSEEGIRIFDDKTHSEVTPWDSVTQQGLITEENLVNDVFKSANGRALLAMYQGVFQASSKGNGFVTLDTIPSLKKFLSVNSVLEDKHGNIWAARWGALTQTSPEGNLKLLLTVRDGFYDTEIRGLAEDAAGNIWIGNWEGLYCYDITRKLLLRFTTRDGLVNNNTASRIFMNDNGNELFVGQVNSFNMVMIDQLQTQSEKPVIAISSFKVQDKDYFSDLSKPVILKRSDNSFSVDFVALNYQSHDENQYAYFLEGLEDDWKFSASNHLVRYTNLMPGKYTLHLKAGEGIENWYDETLKLEIEVLPAYYETWWFRVCVITTIITFLYSLYRYRIQQLLRLQQVRNRISADLHDELGSSLSGISIMGTLAQKSISKEHESSQYISRIVDEVKQVSGSLDDIVWNISPKNDTLSSLMARMMRYASELFEARQIKYEFVFPENVERIRLSMEQRRNFYLVFKESVNNLVKYSRCSLASIRISVLHNSLLLMVEDNGIGFDMTKQSDRNGLRNMKDRSEKLGGSFTIRSLPGNGTTVELQFPM